MNTTLPIYQIKDQLLKAVQQEENQVIILSSDTSTGKSSQVPYILWKELGLSSVITQPRRLACVALSNYIRENIPEEERAIVGYRTGFEQDYDTKTNKILYVTDGILAANGLMGQFDCVIIDEIHEWSLNIEVVIAYIKRMLQKHRTYKVILMSATMDITSLQSFFWNYNPVIIYGPKAQYETKVIEDIHEYEDNDQLYDHIIDHIKHYSKNNNILCFLPGKKEIDYVNNHLDTSIKTFILHGDQTVDEQKLAFEHIHKIILSTNICQTSITIDDIDVVIDCGKIKQIQVKDGIKGLYTVNISQSDCMQRKGRAGRVKNGIYVLCSDINIKNREQFTVPEIKRIPLEDVILRLMSMNIDIRQMEFIHKPNENNIITAIRLLRRLEIITNNNIVLDLGREATKIPLNLQYAIMLVTSKQYGEQVFDKVAKICACLQVNGLLDFFTNYKQFTTENASDLFAEYDVFQYIDKHPNINFKAKGINEKHYQKACEYYEKIKEYNTDINKEYISKNIDLDIQKCILTGFKDTLYTLHYDNSVLISSSINLLGKLDYNSCIDIDDKFKQCFVGIPRMVNGSLLLISNATLINPEIYEEIIGPINYTLDAEYDKDNDDIYIKEFVASAERFDSTGIFYAIYDTLLSDVENKYKDIITQEWNKLHPHDKLQYFKIDNLSFPIYQQKDILPYINIDIDQVSFNTTDRLFMNNLADNIKNENMNNEYIFLTYNDFSYYNLSKIFSEVDHSQYYFALNISQQLITLGEGYSYDDDHYLEVYFNQHKPIYIISKDVNKIKEMLKVEQEKQWQIITNMKNRWILIHNAKYRVECIYKNNIPDDLTLRDRRVDEKDSFFKKENIDNYELPDPIYYANIRVDDMPYTTKTVYFRNKPLLLAHKNAYSYNPNSLNEVFVTEISKRRYLMGKKLKRKAERIYDKLVQKDKSMPFADHIHPVREKRGQYYIEISEKSINKECYKNIHTLKSRGTDRTILFKCGEYSNFDLAELIKMVNKNLDQQQKQVVEQN